MRTLYVSDLDGTLLRSDERTSGYTNRTVNRLVGEGMLFSYCKHSCRMRNPEREVGKSCFFLQIASQSHFSGAFEAENNENGCISALGLK